jgi:hypothetical protein
MNYHDRISQSNRDYTKEKRKKITFSLTNKEIQNHRRRDSRSAG